MHSGPEQVPGRVVGEKWRRKSDGGREGFGLRERYRREGGEGRGGDKLELSEAVSGEY